MRKLRLRKLRYLIQDHPITNWRSQDSNQVHLTLKFFAHPGFLRQNTLCRGLPVEMPYEGPPSPRQTHGSTASELALLTGTREEWYLVRNKPNSPTCAQVNIISL